MLQDRDETVAVIRSILCRRASSNTRGFERSGSVLQAVAAIAGVGCSAGNRPASF